MFYVYDKEGKAFRINHMVDVMVAINTGNYTKLPPGAKEPPKPEKIPEGERIEGIEIKLEEQADSMDVDRKIKRKRDRI